MSACRRTAATLALALAWLGIWQGGSAIAGPPTLLVPPGVRPDTLPLSEPAPFIVPGQAPVDTSDRLRGTRAREYFLIGTTMERTRPGTALAAYESALRLDPLYPQANYRLGLLIAEAGHYPQAARFFEAELVRDSTHAGASRELGLAWSRSGAHVQATERLERLTRERPGDDEAWHALGYAYKQAERMAEAETAYGTAIRLPPRRAIEHRDLGVLLASLERDREARAEFKRAASLDPKDATTWYNLGNMERRRARLGDALAAYRRAEAADSNLAIAVQGQAAVLETMGRDFDAGRTFARWLAHHPADHDARDQTVRLLVKVGRPDLALETARDGVRLNPKAVEARVILGQTLAQQGAVDEALLELETAERLAKDEGARTQVHALVEALRATRNTSRP